MRAELTPAQDKRIAGLGIAMPFELWNWADTAGAPRDIMDEWRHRDIRADIQAQCEFPGLSAERRHLGLRRRTGVRPDRRRCATSSISTSAPLPAAASCSTAGFSAGRPAMPARWARCRCRGRTASRRSSSTSPRSPCWKRRLTHAASRLRICGRRLRTGARSAPNSTTGSPAPLQALAYAIVAASSVIDFEAAVIDGWMPARCAAPAGRCRSAGGHRHDRRRRPEASRRCAKAPSASMPGRWAAPACRCPNASSSVRPRISQERLNADRNPVAARSGASGDIARHGPWRRDRACRRQLSGRRTGKPADPRRRSSPHSGARRDLERAAGGRLRAGSAVSRLGERRSRRLPIRSTTRSRRSAPRARRAARWLRWPAPTSMHASSRRYAIVATSEPRLYANIIIRKGVIYPPENKKS